MFVGILWLFLFAISGEGIDNLSNWMRYMPPEARSKSLFSLKIPGSHNSFAYFLDKNGDWGNDIEISDSLKNLDWLLNIKDIIYRYARTQNFNTSHQLDIGIRFFDMRVSRPEGYTGSTDAQNLRIVHGLYGNKVSLELNEIRKFMDSHPGEIVILTLSHFYNMDRNTHSSLQHLIKNTFGNRIQPYIAGKPPTLRSMSDQQRQIIIIYNYEFLEPGLWNWRNLKSHWPDTTDTREMIDEAEIRLRHRKNQNYGFFITQGVLTVDHADVLTNIFGSLQNDFANLATFHFSQWLKTLTNEYETKLNVAICDFVEKFNFTSNVIRLNIDA